MATEYIYLVADGGHFLASKRTIRKAPSDPAKLRPYVFAPMAQNGTDRAKVARYTVTDPATFAAWQDAADSDARLAALAGIEPLVGESNVTPTRPQVLAALATFGQEAWTTMLASGWLAYASDRADRASGTAANGRKLTADERHAAAIADMFADLDAATAPVESDGTAENASESDASESESDASDAEPQPEVPVTGKRGNAR